MQQLVNRPNDAELHTRLGQTLEAHGIILTESIEESVARRLDRAEESRSLHESSRTPPEAASQCDRAIDQYWKVTQLLPENFAPRRYALALALQKKGDDKTAIAEFDWALKVRPSDPDATLGRATSLDKAGRTDEAVSGIPPVSRACGRPQARPTGSRARLAVLGQANPQVK